MRLRSMELDVLIPNEPGVLKFAEALCEIDKVEAVKIRVIEVDDRTKTVLMTIAGDALSFEAISEAIEEAGGSVHSIDEVSAVTSQTESPRAAGG
jgi:uncharacterized protein